MFFSYAYCKHSGTFTIETIGIQIFTLVKVDKGFVADQTELLMKLRFFYNRNPFSVKGR